MSILDKAKELSNKVSEKATEFSSDELIADTIIKAVAKQEKVNRILREKQCNYRISDIDLEMGIPPSVIFGVRRISEDSASEESTESMLPDDSEAAKS